MAEPGVGGGGCGPREARPRSGAARGRRFRRRRPARCARVPVAAARPLALVRSTHVGDVDLRTEEGRGRESGRGARLRSGARRTRCPARTGPAGRRRLAVDVRSLPESLDHPQPPADCLLGGRTSLGYSQGDLTGASRCLKAFVRVQRFVLKTKTDNHHTPTPPPLSVSGVPHTFQNMNERLDGPECVCVYMCMCVWSGLHYCPDSCNRI